MAPSPAEHEGYLLRGFRHGDEDAYIELMHSAGFEGWNRENMEAVLTGAVPNGVIFAEHVATSRLVATAMGWYRPTEVFADAYEMGWVATDPAHRGKALGRSAVAAVTGVLLGHGAVKIYLLTDDWRLPAIKGYLKIGYAPFCGDTEMRTRWQEVLAKLDLNAQEYVVQVAG